MVRATVARKARRSWDFSREPVCQGCARAMVSESADRRVRATVPAFGDQPVPCVSCRLPVLFQPDPRRKLDACSDVCRLRYYAKRRVAPLVTPTCDGCGEPMTGRADRRYCSPACRQRAYRQRVTSGATPKGG